MKPGSKQPTKQELVIAALISAPTVAEAAKNAGIGETTIWRWMQDEDFQTAYREAKKAALSQAIASLQHATSVAARTLLEVMQDPEAPHSARNQAARTVLEFSLRGAEFEQLEERITVLEKAVGGAL